MKNYILFSALNGSALEIEADEIRKAGDSWVIRANGETVGEFLITATAGYILLSALPGVDKVGEN